MVLVQTNSMLDLVGQMLLVAGLGALLPVDVTSTSAAGVEDFLLRALVDIRNDILAMGLVGLRTKFWCGNVASSSTLCRWSI